MLLQVPKRCDKYPVVPDLRKLTLGLGMAQLTTKVDDKRSPGEMNVLKDSGGMGWAISMGGLGMAS